MCMREQWWLHCHNCQCVIVCVTMNLFCTKLENSFLKMFMHHVSCIMSPLWPFFKKNVFIYLFIIFLRLLFYPKWNSPLKGKGFQTVDEIQENTMRQLMAIPWKGYAEWKRCWDECVKFHVAIFKSDCSIILYTCIFFQYLLFLTSKWKI